MTVDIEGSELPIHRPEDSLSPRGVLGLSKCGHASVDPGGRGVMVSHLPLVSTSSVLCMVKTLFSKSTKPKATLNQVPVIAFTHP